MALDGTESVSSRMSNEPSIRTVKLSFNAPPRRLACASVLPLCFCGFVQEEALDPPSIEARKHADTNAARFHADTEIVAELAAERIRALYPPVASPTMAPFCAN